jgi:hypothetical protein
MHYRQELDPCNIMTRMFKYSFLGIAVIVALHTIPKNKLVINDILMITATIVLVYFFLETPMFKKETYTKLQL